MSSISAMIFARDVHRDQRRKYTCNPYVDHLAEVAGIAAPCRPEYVTEDAFLSVCWLHDCMEDQGVLREDLQHLFGDLVAYAVLMLSDLGKDGNRAQRKANDRERLAGAPGWVQTIKVADMISNTSSIVQHDPDFARICLPEKALMLDVLTDADEELVHIARQQITEATINLSNFK